jgi:hypothetical protein
MVCGIISGEVQQIVEEYFMSKRIIRIMAGVKKRVFCKELCKKFSQ